MPIYEYKCKACGNEFEYRQRISDPPMSECESCGGGLEKLISRSSFLLKGSGWYKDLYSSPKPASGGSDGSSSGNDSSNGSGGDASSTASKKETSGTASSSPASSTASSTGE